MTAVGNLRVSKDSMKTAALINECSDDKIWNVVPGRRACVFYYSCLNVKCESFRIDPTAGVKAESRSGKQNMMLERSRKRPHPKCYKDTRNRSFTIEDAWSSLAVWTCSDPACVNLNSGVKIVVQLCLHWVSTMGVQPTNMHTRTSWCYYYHTGVTISQDLFWTHHINSGEEC